MPRYRIKNKRIHILIWPQKCPIKVSASTDARTPVSPPPVPYIPCGAERGGHQKSKVLPSSGISFLSFSFSCLANMGKATLALLLLTGLVVCLTGWSRYIFRGRYIYTFTHTRINIDINTNTIQKT